MEPAKVPTYQGKRKSNDKALSVEANPIEQKFTQVCC